MLTSVRGRYLNGQIELYEPVSGIEEAEVIVTFIEKKLLPDTDLPGQEHTLSPLELIILRQQLAAFEEDWNAPGMEAYDAL